MGLVPQLRLQPDLNIMLPFKNLFYVLLIPLLAELCCSINTAVQLDLIFPRNNSVYQPVYPFPLVFGVSNFSSASQFKPTVRWRLHEYYPKGDDSAFANDGIIGWENDTAQPDFGAQPDKYLSIASSKAPSESNQSHWILEYTLFVGKNRCFAEDSDPTSRGALGRVFFNTSLSSGAMPNITASGACPFTLGTAGILGENNTDAACPLMPSTMPAPVPCSFQINSQMADQVSKAMVANSGCVVNNVTWPLGTGIGKQCSSRKESESTVLKWSPITMVISLLMLMSLLGCG